MVLTTNQISQVHSLFLAIDKRDKPIYLINAVIEQVFDISCHQGIYLLWLMNRWVDIRKNKQHLPERITRSDQQF
jgi:hypothetical protein